MLWAQTLGYLAQVNFSPATGAPSQRGTRWSLSPHLWGVRNKSSANAFLTITRAVSGARETLDSAQCFQPKWYSLNQRGCNPGHRRTGALADRPKSSPRNNVGAASHDAAAYSEPQVGPCSVFSGCTMASARVTRSQIAGSSSDEQDLNREEASAELEDSGAHSMQILDSAAQVRIKELEIEALKLQIELQKLKLQAVPSDDIRHSDRCDLARFLIFHATGAVPLNCVHTRLAAFLSPPM
ncbi:hypothetical protein HPB50_010796 [Hyalomma asiaticum]|uniref:Uncharacterized protein n=1 Tax=Hyalomma asiaticum TaxID=266040 RepID=A0ACB7TFY1_HYAAI|nr:hypothetical protein HPB50_010796 [Hyalomma asiaticum]